MTKKIFLFIVVLLWAIFALGCSSGWGSVAINATNFPDEEFRNYLRSAYNEILDDDEIARIKSFTVPVNVRDLSGIKFFTSLETLTVVDPYTVRYGIIPLTTLDVSGMESLKSITFAIPSADVFNASSCTSLEKLRLWNISSFNIDGCTAIKNIELHSEKLNVVNLTNFTSLEELTVFCDNMSALAVRGCSSLKNLHIASNNKNFNNLDLTGCNALEELWMYSLIYLNRLDVSYHENLKSLKCSSCNLKSLNINGCSSLEDLDCDNNQLIMLDLSSSSKYISGKISPQKIERSERLITRTGNANYPYQFNLKSIGIPTSKLKNIVDVRVRNVSHDYIIAYGIYDRETGIASFKEKPEVIRYLYNTNKNRDFSDSIRYMNVDIYMRSSVNLDPEITTASLPDGKIGETYNKTLEATGTTPFLWSTYDELPEGLRLSSDGKISGTPNKAGNFLISFAVSNDVGIDIRAFDLIIKNNSEDESEPPIITTTSLPAGTVNKNYKTTLDARGTAPIIWSVSQNNLPNGLTLSSGGEISGIPLQQGIYNFTVRASNDAGIDTQDLRIVINLASQDPIIITKPSITTQLNLPTATVGTFYQQQLSATGTTPITWRANELPKNLTCNSSGVISGIPESSGVFNITVIAENSAGSDEKIFSLIILNNSNGNDDNDEDDFDEEFANNMREFLGKENSTPVKNLSSENASINNNVEAPIYWDDENNGEIIALLPEIIVDTDGIYLLRVSFDETVEAGSNLKWYSFAQNANSASAKISEIEGEDYVFLDDEGNQIISPTINALDYMNVAVFFEANKKYSPVISAISKKNNNSNNNANNNNNNTVTSSGGGGGGCNFNFGILSAILALTFLIRNVKIKQQ